MLRPAAATHFSSLLHAGPYAIYSKHAALSPQPGCAGTEIPLPQQTYKHEVRCRMFLTDVHLISCWLTADPQEVARTETLHHMTRPLQWIAPRVAMQVLLTAKNADAYMLACLYLAGLPILHPYKPQTYLKSDVPLGAAAPQGPAHGWCPRSCPQTRSTPGASHPSGSAGNRATRAGT